MAVMTRKSVVTKVIAMADAVTCCLTLALIAIILVSALREESLKMDEEQETMVGGRLMGGRPCNEIYVVGEGETLHTISDKCGDPYIVERNPHIHDPDDVFPGLVIKLDPTSSKNRRSNY